MALKRFNGDTVVYFVCAALLLILGLLLVPNFILEHLGYDILNYILAAAILIYLFGYLVHKMRYVRSTLLFLTIVEFVLLFLVALGLVLQQFNIVKVQEPCQILGLALALRGIVEMFRAYYHQMGSNARYPLAQFIVNLIILIFGVYIFARPFIGRADLVWVMVVVCFVGAILCLVLGIMTMQSRRR